MLSNLEEFCSPLHLPHLWSCKWLVTKRSRLLCGVWTYSSPDRCPHETASIFTSKIQWATPRIRKVIIVEQNCLLFIVRTGAKCWLNKAEYQMWTMKPAPIDLLKVFQCRIVKRSYGSNQFTKTGDINDKRRLQAEKGSQVWLVVLGKSEGTVGP